MYRKIKPLLLALCLLAGQAFAAGKDTVNKTPDVEMTGSVFNFNEKDTLVRGARYILTGVHFLIDRHVMKKESMVELKRLQRLLLRQPDLNIRIEGHVCCVMEGKDALDIDTYKLNLSEERAMAVWRSLIKLGVDRQRLSYIGLARKYPIIENEMNEQDAAVNRRVEIRVMEP